MRLKIHNMIILEVLSLSLGVLLCCQSTRNDCKLGIIKNRDLAVFLSLAVMIDVIYYGVFAKDLLGEFLTNILLIIFLSLCLFYSHSFAGGDCKFAIVLAFLYPARYYAVLNGSNITLYWVIPLSILGGFFYLFVDAIRSLLSRKTVISWKYVRDYALSFGKSYVSAVIYIATLNLLLSMIIDPDRNYSIWLMRIVCFLLAWCVGKYPKMRSKNVIVVVGLALGLMCLMMHKVPISLHPEDYIMVMALLLAQMIIKTVIYEEIPAEKLQKGMILSTFSSALMQNSITNNLPGISTEDLRSRLSAEEAEAAIMWARATRSKTFTVVRKIPFAVFISLGFIIYFAIGSVPK